MKGGSGIIPLFSMQQVGEYAQGKVDGMNEKTLLVLQKMGEDFIDKARGNRTYKDRTGNLRASIGYIIAHDGKLIENSFAFNEGKGGTTGVNYAMDLIGNYPQGLVLIGVAGMKYALFVEAKGYDVISGAEPSQDRLNSFLNEIK